MSGHAAIVNPACQYLGSKLWEETWPCIEQSKMKDAQGYRTQLVLLASCYILGIPDSCTVNKSYFMLYVLVFLDIDTSYYKSYYFHQSNNKLDLMSNVSGSLQVPPSGTEYITA